MNKLTKPIKIILCLLLAVSLFTVVTGCGNNDANLEENNNEEGLNENNDQNNDSEDGQEIDSDIYDLTLPAEQLVEEHLDRIIEQLEVDWETKGGSELNYPEDTEVNPEDFNEVLTAAYSPGETRVAFSLGGPYVSLVDSSAMGVIDMVKDEIIITNIQMGQTYLEEGLAWEQDDDHFAYILFNASGEGILYIDSALEGINIEEFKGEQMTYEENQIVSVKDLDWDGDGYLFFTSFEVEDDSQEKHWFYELETNELVEVTK